MSIIEKLHQAIHDADYNQAEQLIFEENANPLIRYKGKTAIELCFHIQKKANPDKLTVYQMMLDNLFFPQADRYLIGTEKAARGNIMLINDAGSIQVVHKNEKIDEDNALYRTIGMVDYRLSDDFRTQRLNHENSRRFY